MIPDSAIQSVKKNTVALKGKVYHLSSVIRAQLLYRASRNAESVSSSNITIHFIIFFQSVKATYH